MGNVGPMELFVVLIIALIVFGPKRLPEMGRSLGKGLREFKEAVTGAERPDEHEIKHAGENKSSRLYEGEPVDGRKR